MSNRETKPIGTFDTFEELFQRAEDRPSYWVELGKLEFTEEMLSRMKELGVSKSFLAASLGVKPAMVTRLVSGHNNFTIETMIRVAHALNCEFRSHLQPKGCKSSWIDILIKEPQRTVASWASEEYKNVITSQPKPIHESFADAA
jgi:transcriptional regulator with XRE-family HTH domain